MPTDQINPNEQHDRFMQQVHRYQQSTFGSRYSGVSLALILLQPEAQSKIAAFIKKPTNFLVFCGNPGSRKTYPCACLVEWAMKNFRCFRYRNESELLKRLRSSMDSMVGDYLDALKYLIDDDFLMIDDIGSCGLTDWRKEVLFDTIDERYCSMKPSLITSNFSRQDFMNNYPERIVSRLFAKENIVIEQMDGIDLRRN